MATVRTLSSAAKWFNFKNALMPHSLKLSPVYLKQTGLQLDVPVRYATYRRGPKMDDREVNTEVEVVTDPAAWAAVERLIADTTISFPKAKAEYPSGWKPPAPKKDLPYSIQRTANHMHSVHMNFNRLKQRRLTVVRRIQGDIWAFEKDLTAYLVKVREDPYVTSSVNEVFGKIYYRGDHVNNIKVWLERQGF